MFSGITDLNLMPEQFKEKILRSLMIKVAICVFVVLVVAFGVLFLNKREATIMLDSANSSKTEEGRINSDIAKTQDDIAAIQKSIQNKSARYFNYSDFMERIYAGKPENMSLMSIDTEDRLVTKEAASSTSAQSSDLTNKVEVASMIYKQVYIRGYSSDAADITAFITNISTMTDTIADVTLTSIEEVIDNSGAKASMFELIVRVKNS